MAHELDRRALLRWGAIGGAAALRPPAARTGTPSATTAPPAPVDASELDEASIADLQKRMVAKQDTSRSICEKYMARIEALDRRGPALRAVLEVNPDALQIAASLDAERAAGKLRGPLHGIPVLIKDNIGTADRM